ncbi:hypothetical protein OF83DRAFT_1220756, partial [Amylostereum chailletii]
MPSMSGNAKPINRVSVTAVLPKHLGHTKELVLHGDAREFHPVSYTLFDVAPVLNRLEVRCDGPGPAPGTAISSYPVIPPSFSAPSLKILVLHNVVFSWSSFSSSNLTSINLQFVTNTPSLLTATSSSSGPFASSLFIKSLNAMKNLEHLFLQGILPMSYSRDDVAELPKLKKLSLTSSPSRCLDFWNAIRIPPLAKLHVTSINSRGNNNEPGSAWRTLVSTLSVYLHSPARNISPIRTLAISCPPHNSITLLGWQRYRSKAEAQEVFNQLGDPDELLHLDWSPMHFGNPVGLNVNLDMNVDLDKPTVCRSLPLRCLRALKVAVHPMDMTWHKSLWVDLFMPSKEVKHVAVVGGGACTICQALVTVDDALQPESEGRKLIHREAVFLPKLSSVAFSNVDFDLTVQGQPFYQNLQRWLSKRRKVKAAVKHLRLESCKIERYQVSMLEEAVQELHCVDLF